MTIKEFEKEYCKDYKYFRYYEEYLVLFINALDELELDSFDLIFIINKYNLRDHMVYFRSLSNGINKGYTIDDTIVDDIDIISYLKEKINFTKLREYKLNELGI